VEQSGNYISELKINGQVKKIKTGLLGSNAIVDRNLKPSESNMKLTR